MVVTTDGSDRDCPYLVSAPWDCWQPRPPTPGPWRAVSQPHPRTPSTLGPPLTQLVTHSVTPHSLCHSESLLWTIEIPRLNLKVERASIAVARLQVTRRWLKLLPRPPAPSLQARPPSLVWSAVAPRMRQVSRSLPVIFAPRKNLYQVNLSHDLRLFYKIKCAQDDLNCCWRDLREGLRRIEKLHKKYCVSPLQPPLPPNPLKKNYFQSLYFGPKSSGQKWSKIL